MLLREAGSTPACRTHSAAAARMASEVTVAPDTADTSRDWASTMERGSFSRAGSAIPAVSEWAVTSAEVMPLSERVMVRVRGPFRPSAVAVYVPARKRMEGDASGTGVTSGTGEAVGSPDGAAGWEQAVRQTPASRRAAMRRASSFSTSFVVEKSAIRSELHKI